MEKLENPSQSNGSGSAVAIVVLIDYIPGSGRGKAGKNDTPSISGEGYRQIRKFCRQHDGEVLNFIDEGLLISFGDAIHAIACAIEIQAAQVQYALEESISDVYQFRMGAHIGRLILKDGRASGDVINLVKRLQSEAEPGGICISQGVYERVSCSDGSAILDEVHENIHSELVHEMVVEGPRNLKHSSDTFPVYDLLLPEIDLDELRVRSESSGESGASKSTTPSGAEDTATAHPDSNASGGDSGADSGGSDSGETTVSTETGGGEEKVEAEVESPGDARPSETVVCLNTVRMSDPSIPYVDSESGLLRASIYATCTRYDGSVANYKENGYLMMFTDTTRAVECALEIQKKQARVAVVLPADQVLQHRIGIHVGDIPDGEVVLHVDDVFLAENLRNAAHPGNICMSPVPGSADASSQQTAKTKNFPSTR